MVKRVCFRPRAAFVFVNKSQMKRIALIIGLLLLGTGVFSQTLDGTLVRTCTADPCLIFDNGYFYLTMTGSSRIAMVSDKRLSMLGTDVHPTMDNIVYNSAYDPSVEELFGPGATINGTWSPEMHYFSEEEFPGESGWYMYFSLRQKMEDSRNIRMVVLKSASGRVDGPFVSPVTGTTGQTQPFLNPDGSVLVDWCLGPSLLRIPTGKYKGVYLTWVEETGRGEGLGKFYQIIKISKISKPWKLEGESAIITVPTQEWEFHGSSQTYPRVVEGATAVYGDHGEIFMAYCGSGFWSDYGLGQLTLLRDGDDYADPMKTESWIKYEGNPVFSSARSSELRGAGHGFFLTDAKGQRFFCYHAYPVVNGRKSKTRNAYIEPYFIDYGAACPSAPYGVLIMGAMGNGKCAPVDTPIRFSRK